jgi:cell volume regulation protein A
MPAALIAIGALVFGAHLFKAVFQKTRLPDVLPFTLLGVLVGPMLGWVTPEHFGSVGAVFASVVLVVILFEGGLNLKLRDLLDSMALGTRLTFVAFLVTGTVLALLGRALLGLTWIEAMMLGSILGGTSSAVVIPMAQALPLSEKTRTALFLESSLSDVLCIVVTLALAATISQPELAPGKMVGQILATFLLAAMIGAAGGLAWSAILDRVHDLDHSISTTPAFMLLVYGFAELLGYSGAIAALAFGVTLGNISDLPLKVLQRFASFRPVTVSEFEKEVYAEVVFIAKAFFFLYIGLQIKGSGPALWGAAALAVILVYAARVPVIRAAFDPGTTRDDASVAAVMAPKGLAAAVLASVPLQAGFAGGADIEAFSYAVVLCSIVTTSALVFLIGRDPWRGFYRRMFGAFVEEAG